MENIQKKNGFMSHHAVHVGIKINIMNGIRMINKKKNSSIGIFNDIMENVIQKQHGVIKKNHHMKKSGFHHGTYIKETII